MSERTPQAEAAGKDGYPPTRTFKPRRRHVSAARAASHERLLGLWALDATGPPLDLPAIFGRLAPVILDVGFGGGEATIEMALADPGRDVIAVEVHTPGLARVLAAVDDLGLTNIRVVDGDVKEFLLRLAIESLDEVRIYFSDPWPKLRQQRRRLIQTPFVEEVTDRLVPGGRLHLATDIADYAAQMAAVCDAASRLAGGVIPRPHHRPVTRFEQRGLNAGRGPVDLLYRRIS